MSLDSLANVADDPGGESTGSLGFSVVPYEPWHLHLIALQPHQQDLNEALLEHGWAESVGESGQVWTVLDGETPIGCGGFIEHWKGRVTVWAVLSRDAGPHMLAISRAVKAEIARHPAERIEAQVKVGFPEGVRWMRLLGFTPECVLRKWNRGQDYQAFVLLKDG